MECASGRPCPKFVGPNGVMVSTSSVRVRDARASQARSGTKDRSRARLILRNYTINAGKVEPLTKKKGSVGGPRTPGYVRDTVPCTMTTMRQTQHGLKEASSICAHAPPGTTGTAKSAKAMMAFRNPCVLWDRSLTAWHSHVSCRRIQDTARRMVVYTMIKMRKNVSARRRTPYGTGRRRPACQSDRTAVLLTVWSKSTAKHTDNALWPGTTLIALVCVQAFTNLLMKTAIVI